MTMREIFDRVDLKEDTNFEIFLREAIKTINPFKISIYVHSTYLSIYLSIPILSFYLPQEGHKLSDIFKLSGTQKKLLNLDISIYLFDCSVPGCLPIMFRSVNCKCKRIKKRKTKFLSIGKQKFTPNKMPT